MASQSTRDWYNYSKQAMSHPQLAPAYGCTLSYLYFGQEFQQTYSEQFVREHKPQSSTGAVVRPAQHDFSGVQEYLRLEQQRRLASAGRGKAQEKCTSNAGTGLLSLPPEIRNMIWAYAVAERSTTTAPADRRSFLQPPVTKVSRQIRDEALELWHREKGVKVEATAGGDVTIEADVRVGRHVFSEVVTRYAGSRFAGTSKRNGWLTSGVAVAQTTSYWGSYTWE